MTVLEITPIELNARLESGNVPVLLDVREPFEAEIADLPELGQLRIPTGEFATRVGEVAQGPEIVVYCRSGARSEWAANILMANGHERVLNLRGGVLGWRADVDPSLRAY